MFQIKYCDSKVTNINIYVIQAIILLVVLAVSQIDANPAPIIFRFLRPSKWNHSES